jgi:hypothetical protein
MAMISIDERTRDALASQAACLGISLEDYLRKLASPERPDLSVAELDSLLDELAIESPPLPPDFSRADIYLDHD